MVKVTENFFDIARLNRLPAVQITVTDETEYDTG